MGKELTKDMLDKKVNRIEFLIWVGISFVLALIGTIMIYPFIGLADGYTRWYSALEIAKNGKIVTDNLMSPIIPYFQALTYKITGSCGPYTFLQAGFFYLAIGMLFKMFIGHIRYRKIPVWLIASFVTVLIPTVFVFPLMLTDSSPIFTVIVFMGWFLLSKLDTRYKAIIMGVLSFLAISIRINAVIMIGLLILALIIKGIREKAVKHFILIGAIILGCLIGVVTMNIFAPGKHNAATLGMTWELVGQAVVTKDEELITELGKYGNIDKAMDIYGEPSLNFICWDGEPPYPAMDISGRYSKDITKLYINEYMKHPVSFMFNKLYFVERVLGVNAPLMSSKWGVADVDELTQMLGGKDTQIQKDIRQAFFFATDGMSFISLRPTVAFFITILLTVIVKLLKGKTGEFSLLIFLAAFYYSSFCLNTQSFEYRYFAPSFYILLCAMAGLTIEIVRLLLTKDKSKGQRT